MTILFRSSELNDEKRAVKMGEPEDERQRLVAELHAVGRRLSDAMVLFHFAASERLGLGPTDWKTLGMLEQDGPLTAGELVARTGLAPASVTGILNRLEAGGRPSRPGGAGASRRVVVELAERAVPDEREAIFGALIRNLEALYAGYSEEELAFLGRALGDMARIQAEATADLARPGAT
jgi:DNA-binding MarR family transcriptional regulator